jgi:hypothetical protein
VESLLTTTGGTELDGVLVLPGRSERIGESGVGQELFLPNPMRSC